jgi:predicted nuclease with RNAse H fold
MGVEPADPLLARILLDLGLAVEGVACAGPAVTMDVMGRWMGVDVGGRRKGFDVALVEDRRLVGLRQRQSVGEVVAWVASARPAVVAVDSPRSCAAPGQTHRPDERALRAAVCGIRWTPPRGRLGGNPYYGWVVEGLRLYDALADQPVEVVECFPTASWTRWRGPRAGRSRSAWTREGLAALGLEGVPARTNQDVRDAIAAALTAREHGHGRCEAFGEIVVPRGQPLGCGPGQARRG